MAFEDYQTKQSVVVVYTGEGKGKTSAGVGLLVRGLGAGWKVAFVQFIKHWQVSEHDFIDTIAPLYDGKLLFYKGGKGFYNAGNISEKNVTEAEHKQAALDTYNVALGAVQGGEYDLVVCDEINNAVHDKLLTTEQMAVLFDSRDLRTSLCMTGRDFPEELLNKVDIATHMSKIKHHFDDKFLANKGIDF